MTPAAIPSPSVPAGPLSAEPAAFAPSGARSKLDPILVQCLAPSENLESSFACTRQLAHSHYENFSVVSVLLPRSLRQDFCNIYAFCRIADDLGDELGSREESTIELARLKRQTEEAFAGRLPGVTTDFAWAEDPDSVPPTADE